MCNTLNIKALELYCNIKKWNIELDTLSLLWKKRDIFVEIQEKFVTLQNVKA